MAQLLVRNLDQAVEAGEEPPAQGGLGRNIASLFAAAELEQPIREWRGEESAPAALDS